MSRTPERGLLGMRAGMELCWRYAWAEYAVRSLLDRPFPLLRAAGVLATAAVLTALARGRGWRVIGVLLLQALGLAAAALLLVHGVYRHPLAWWDLRWVGAFLHEPRTAGDVLVLGLVLFWALTFWLGGVTLARRAPAYLDVCTRFDLGGAAFLGLFLVRWLVRAQGGVETGGALPELLLFPYFVFGLFAIGLARNRSTGGREFLAGQRGAGAVFAVGVGVLFLGAALAVLFLPYLTAAAETGYAVLSAAARPFGPVLLRFLRFVLVGRRGATAPGGGHSPGPDPTMASPPTPSGWERFLDQIFAWGLVGLLGALALAVVALSAWFLLRWLLTQTRREESDKGLRWDLWRPLVELWTRLTACLARWVRWLHSGGSTRRTAAWFYASLRTWGIRSGLAPAVAETPSEYGRRLSGRFPTAAPDIDEIVSLYNGEVYGGRSWDAARLSLGSRARGRLKSPRLWPARLRSCLRRGEVSDPGARQ